MRVVRSRVSYNLLALPQHHRAPPDGLLNSFSLRFAPSLALPLPPLSLSLFFRRDPRLQLAAVYPPAVWPLLAVVAYAKTEAPWFL